jgi:rubrerythrin
MRLNRNPSKPIEHERSAINDDHECGEVNKIVGSTRAHRNNRRTSVKIKGYCGLKVAVFVLEESAAASHSSGTLKSRYSADSSEGISYDGVTGWFLLFVGNTVSVYLKRGAVMGLKNMKKSSWVCVKCKKHTDQPGKVCMECKTGKTVIKGLVSSKSSKTGNKRVNNEDMPDKAVSKPFKDASMCDVLGRALDLEVEGREFYLKCSQSTKSSDGKDMFMFLANEEKIHYDRIAQLYEREDYKGYCDYVQSKGLESGVFSKRVKGGTLDDKSDALSALNVGIKAEENSIELYSALANEAISEEMKLFFERLVSEERRHRNILANEVEFVTGTGDFKDFTTITM